MGSASTFPVIRRCTRTEVRSWSGSAITHRPSPTFVRRWRATSRRCGLGSAWGAARGLQGYLEEALEIFAEGIEKTQFEGPSVFVYRGEFLRLLGNHDDAARDLDKAVQHKPQRLSAWINRVLLDAEMGEVAPLHALTRTLKRTNPGLWCDAAESVGADPTDLNQSRAVMNAILALMKGNRSQVITYWLANGALRFAKWTTACAPDVLAERYGVASPPA